jgi:hypothetical protein
MDGIKKPFGYVKNIFNKILSKIKSFDQYYSQRFYDTIMFWG